MRFSFHGPEMPAKTLNVSSLGIKKEKKTERDLTVLLTDGAECVACGNGLYATEALFVCLQRELLLDLHQEK